MRCRGFEVVKGYEDKGINLPVRKTAHSAGYDVEAAEDIVIPMFTPGCKPTLIPTGLKAYCAEDECYFLLNRSSGPKKGFLMANSIGLIDSDYYGNEDNDGHFYFAYFNCSDHDIEVKKGDTLYSLSKKYGLTVADLLAINNLDSSSVIKVGQKLKVRTTSLSNASQNKSKSVNVNNDIKVVEKAPDTRTYGATVTADTNTKWPVSNPKITQVKGKISGVQLSAKENEKVLCIHEGTVMYVGTYRGFGQVVFVQSKTGLIYAYTGLGSVKVKKGEYVVAAAELGSAGIDPISGKSQITFMVFQNGQPIDPGKAPRS